MRILVSLVLLVLGFVGTFWGGFCLLGGPDGRILSIDSFLYAGIFLLIAVLLISASRKFVPTRALVYAPILICMIAWLAAIVISQYVGFYAWMFGTPGSIFAFMVYWLVAVIRTPSNVV
jgi:hypothetical protein